MEEEGTVGGVEEGGRVKLLLQLHLLLLEVQQPVLLLLLLLLSAVLASSSASVLSPSTHTSVSFSWRRRW